MKKIFIFVLLLTFSNAEIIKDNTTIQTSDYLRNGKMPFAIGNSNGLCLNNVVYYLEGHIGDSRTLTTSISHNPLTDKPYFCKITKLIKSKVQNWATSGTKYDQFVLITHNYLVQ